MLAALHVIWPHSERCSGEAESLVVSGPVIDRTFNPGYWCPVILGPRPRLGLGRAVGAGLARISHTGAKRCTLATGSSDVT